MKRYVMVPVPEQHVEEVEKFLRWSTGPAVVSAWDDESVAAFLGGLDRTARAVLLRAADAAQAEEVLTCEEVARSLGCSEREVVGISIEMNEGVRASGGPLFAVMIDLPSPVDGQPQQPRRLSMPPSLARDILAGSGRGVRTD